MHRLHVVSITCLLAAVLFAGVGGIEHNTAPDTAATDPSTSTTPAAAPSTESDHVLTPEEQDAADAAALKEAAASKYKDLVAEARKVAAPLKSKYDSALSAVADKTTAPAVEDDPRVTYLTGMVVVLIVLLAIAVGFAMLRRPSM